MPGRLPTDSPTPATGAPLTHPGRPFLALVLLLLLAVGGATLVGLLGIARMDATVRTLVQRDARRLLTVTHVRRLFRSELLLYQRSRDLRPDDPRLAQTAAAIRLERRRLLDELREAVDARERPFLTVLEAQHALGRGLLDQDAQPWEAALGALLRVTESRLERQQGAAASSGRTAGLLLLLVSLLGITAAVLLGRAIWRRMRSATDELIRRGERLRVAVDSAPSLLCILDPSGRLTFLAPKAPAFLGVAASRLDADPLGWVVPEDRTRLDEALARVRDTPGAAPTVLVRGRRDDGAAWHASVSLAALAPGAGAGAGVVIQILDVTAQHAAEQARRALEDQLRQAQKLESVGLLAGGIAHDFNNLLTTISGNASLLDEDLHPTSPLHEPLQEILGAAGRAAGLTRQLLAFCRRQVADPRPTDLGEVVARLRPLLVRTLGEDVRLEVLRAPGARRCLVDPGHVEQVLINLAVNARHAMPGGGTLRVETRDAVLDEGFVATHPGARTGAHALLVVSDTGTGMTPEVKARAFEPFFTTKPVDQGTGLGLSVVLGLVQQQGGTIQLESAPGAGTTFHLHWPALDEAAPEASAAPGPPAPPRGDEVVLLVEDDLQVRAFARRVLERQGYTVLEAGTAEEALRVAGARPDLRLLVTDVVLPGRSGLDLARDLHGQRPGLAVLCCSGYPDRQGDPAATLPPEFRFLPKPYSVAQLADAVRGVLDARRPA